MAVCSSGAAVASESEKRATEQRAISSSVAAAGLQSLIAEIALPDYVQRRREGKAS